MPLVENALHKTFMTANAAAAATTITVRRVGIDVTSDARQTNNITVNDVLLIGELGANDSEIVLTHASTEPVDSTGVITLVTGGIVFAHDAGTPVYRIQYNRVQLQRGTTTAQADATNLTTDLTGGEVTIPAYAKTIVYDEVQNTSGNYFARFSNSAASVTGDWTDAVPYGGFATDRVGFAIDWAIKQNAMEGFTIQITHRYCINELNDGMREVQGKLLRWPGQQNLNFILGQTSRGVFSYGLPSDIFDNTSNKSIIAARVGHEQNMRYYSPDEFDSRWLRGVKRTTTRSSTAIGATSVNLDNSYDFDDSGSVNISVSNTRQNITYTGVTRDNSAGATGALTGVPGSGTGSVTATIASGTNVFQSENEGQPIRFTVRNGNLEIDPMPDASWDNKNVYLDYFQITEVNSDNDQLDLHRFDVIRYWLAWKIKMLKNNEGTLDLNDGFYIKYKDRLNDAIRTMGRGIVRKMKPKINTIAYKTAST